MYLISDVTLVVVGTGSDIEKRKDSIEKELKKTHKFKCHNTCDTFRFFLVDYLIYLTKKETEVRSSRYEQHVVKAQNDLLIKRIEGPVVGSL